MAPNVQTVQVMFTGNVEEIVSILEAVVGASSTNGDRGSAKTLSGPKTYTSKQLADMAFADLKKIATGLEIDLSGKKSAGLRKAILEAQEESSDSDDEEETESEDDEDWEDEDESEDDESDDDESEDDEDEDEEEEEEEPPRRRPGRPRKAAAATKRPAKRTTRKAPARRR